MELKIVSFKTAKALKEAGYPQDCCNEYWIKFKNKPEPLIINGDEALDFYENISDETDENYVEEYYAVIKYLEVWLWLWREKKIKISAEIWHDKPNSWGSIIEGDTFYKELHGYNDPEEVIIAAIEYIVYNNLIK